MLPNIRWGYWGLSQSIRRIHNWPTSIFFSGMTEGVAHHSHGQNIGLLYFAIQDKREGHDPINIGLHILYPLSSLGISSDAGMTIPHIPCFWPWYTWFNEQQGFLEWGLNPLNRGQQVHFERVISTTNLGCVGSRSWVMGQMSRPNWSFGQFEHEPLVSGWISLVRS